MKNKIHIILGDIMAIVTILVLVFIVVHTFINKNDCDYVFFTQLRNEDQLFITGFFCVTSICYSSYIFIKNRRKMLNCQNSGLCDKISYVMVNISLAILPITNFLLIFKNIYYSSKSWQYIEEQLDFSHFVNFLLFYLFKRISIFVIIISIVNIILARQEIFKCKLNFCKIGIIQSIINLISVFSFQVIIIIFHLIIGATIHYY